MTALLMILSFVAGALLLVLGVLSWRAALHRNPLIERRAKTPVGDEGWSAGYRASAPWTLGGGVGAAVVGITAMVANPDSQATEQLFLLLVLVLAVSSAAAVLAARRAARNAVKAPGDAR